MKASRPWILMVTGIAGPRLFKKHLRGISPQIVELAYPDHHDYSQKDLVRIERSFKEMEGENKFIFTTEKDAMRLRKSTDIDKSTRDRMYYVPLGIDILNEDRENLNNHIRNYVKDNKRDSILHKKQD
jgi:tetraacyldisaccharide 4'-kinase